MNHDRKKEKELTGDALVAHEKAAKERSDKYVHLQQQFLLKHRGKVYDLDGLAVTGQILDINPDNYSCWNYRRRYLLEFFKTSTEEAAQKTLLGELDFAQKAIQRNSKSYWVWKYRTDVCIWLEEWKGKTDWRRELDLCGKLLKLDSRNCASLNLLNAHVIFTGFTVLSQCADGCISLVHCWSYRRFVANKAHATLQEEFQFAAQKISENFSNYSAWHQRSCLLLALHTTPAALKDAATKELEVIHSAFFTDPNDQSCWIYLRWLLTVVPFDSATLANELQICEELLTLEPNCKWPLLTTVELLRLVSPTDARIANRLTQLLAVDPLRANFYRHLSQQCRREAAAQVAQNKTPTTDPFTCSKCKANRCTYYQMQTRSADEPLTTFVTCMACGNRWKC